MAAILPGPDAVTFNVSLAAWGQGLPANVIERCECECVCVCVCVSLSVCVYGVTTNQNHDESRREQSCRPVHGRVLHLSTLPVPLKLRALSFLAEPESTKSTEGLAWRLNGSSH